jgi:hypothetical protein
VTATAIETCDNIWSDETSALLFAIASPRTVATESHIGVLFLLVRRRDGWRIADLLRFTPIGKDSGLSAKLTALAGKKIGMLTGILIWSANKVKTVQVNRPYRLPHIQVEAIDLNRPHANVTARRRHLRLIRPRC